MKWFGRVVIGFAVLLAAKPARAELPPLRTIVLLDRSAQMKASDPNHLSVEGTYLLLGLKRANDRIGVVSFSNQSRWEHGFDGEAKDRLRSLQYDHYSADVDAAAREALRTFDEAPQPRTKDTIVLVVGRPEGTTSAVRLSRELTQTLAVRHIRLDTIELLEPGATETSTPTAVLGSHQVVHDPASMYRAFINVGLSITGANTIPVRGRRFMVGDPQDVVSVIVPRIVGTRTAIRSSNDEVFTATATAKKISWRVAHSFEAITLDAPEVGPWSVEQPMGAPPPFVIVAKSPLRLAAHVVSAKPDAAKAATLIAELRLDDSRTRSFELHDRMRVTALVSNAAGLRSRLELKKMKQGTYEVSLEGIPPGHVDVLLAAEGANVNLERRLSSIIDEPPPPKPVEPRTIIKTAEVAGPWKGLFFAAAGLAAVAFVLVVLAVLRLRRATLPSESVDEAEEGAATAKGPLPPPLPVEVEWKVALLRAADVEALLPPEGPDSITNRTKAAMDAAVAKLQQVCTTHAEWHRGFDKLMKEALAVTNAVQGFDAATDDPAEFRAEIEAGIQGVHDEIGGLRDGAMEQLAETKEVYADAQVFLQKAAMAPTPRVVTHNDFNEVLLSLADDQTAAEFEVLREEMLGALRAVEPQSSLHKELADKSEKVKVLEKSVAELEAVKFALEASLEEVAEEYQTMYQEFQS